MKKVYILSVFVFCGVFAAIAQKPIDFSIRVSATIKKSPASITLSWPKDPNVVNYFIYRKLKTDEKFPTTKLATLAVTDSVYTDNTVSLGINYEYEIAKTIKSTAYYGFGYISSGIEVPAIESRGKLILLVDQSFLPTLQPEIARLILDMTNDGWMVITHPVNKTDSVVGIHNIILGDYTADPNNVKAVFLLGHIPVPYSGGNQSYGLNPIDGHVPQHQGAWPADIYYADMTNVWTDAAVYDTLAEYKANRNIPGDGKFDQDVIPGSVDLQLGRVDMYDMPSFAPLKEIDLIKRYLDKDHRWRMGNVSMQQKGLVKDYFGLTGGESFAASGYKNFAPMFGAGNIIDTGTWEANLSKTSYLWSYGCGGGSYTNASGISKTSDFAKDSLQTVFTMLFGSWFGDWNFTDNYLRAGLASKGPILTCAWSGRPQWQFHHMAMGDNIGYSALLNFNEYASGTKDYTNYFRSSLMSSNDRMIHVALMGDPTLRMHVVQPPGALNLSKNKYVVTINWVSSTEPGLLGYNVYRSNGLNQPFVKISGSSPVSGTSFTDNNALHNKNFYMVRAVKLETNPSGSYFNLSQGSMDTISTDNSGIATLPATLSIDVFPNPSKEVFHIVWPGSEIANGNLEVFDILGNIVLTRQLSALNSNQTIDLNMAKFAKGVYSLKITNGDQIYVQRVIKE